MPSLVTPRSLPVRISLPPGRVEPSSATGTRSTSILQTQRWSESGWGLMKVTLPTTTRSMPSPVCETVSTLEPDMVMPSQNSLSETLIFV